MANFAHHGESNGPDAKSPLAKLSRWLPWLIGAAACAAVVLVVTHSAEEQHFLQLAKKIKPAWLGVALLLQAATYVVQGLTWRLTARKESALTMGKACQLSLAMLFVDQALPTAGVSGITLATGALSRLGIPRPAVASAVVVYMAIYYFAYAFCMSLAAGITMFHGYLPGWVTAAMLLFVLVRLGMGWFLIRLSGGGMKGLSDKLCRVKKLAQVLDFFKEADRESFRNFGLLGRVFLLHSATFFLDASTLWVAILALGGAPPLGGLFASFMVSTFFRTVGIAPGGLGTFEAASVISLKSIHLPLRVGLSATLLFRGLSFWLPMIPGLICSQRLLGKHGGRSQRS